MPNPGSPSKIVKGFGLLSKLEASYNAGGSLSASTDGVVLEEEFTFKITPANDGKRPPPPGVYGQQRRVAPSAFAGDLACKVAPKGAGAAYSASVVPNIHTLLRSCGFNGTVTTTGGSEKWDYTPIAPGDAVASLVQSLYRRQQLYPFQGVLGDFTATFRVGEVPIFEYHGMGVTVAEPTDVALPAITYPNTTQDAPKVVNIGFQVNAAPFAFVIRELRIKWGRNTGPRLDANAVGPHAGFWGVTRNPMLEIDVETPAASLSDLWSMIGGSGAGNAPAAISWQFTIGTTQYNKYTILGPALQQAGLPDEKADSEVAISTVPYQINPSTLNAADDLTWRFN